MQKKKPKQKKERGAEKKNEIMDLHSRKKISSTTTTATNGTACNTTTASNNNSSSSIVVVSNLNGKDHGSIIIITMGRRRIISALLILIVGIFFFRTKEEDSGNGNNTRIRISVTPESSSSLVLKDDSSSTDIATSTTTTAMMMKQNMKTTNADIFANCPIDNFSSSSSSSSRLGEIWDDIDQVVSKYPKSKVSGGIFLYPRQTTLIMSLVSFLAQELLLLEDEEGTTTNRQFTICETGFGAGHSAAMFLESTGGDDVGGGGIDLHLFDKFDRPYQLPALQLIKEKYQNQHQHQQHQHTIHHYVGDSCKTVPQTLLLRDGVVQCDVLHGSSLCKTDNIDLVESSPCGVLLTTTAMNSLRDNVVYFGPHGQWTQLQKKGCIQDITCWAEKKRKLDRTYVFQKDGTIIDHKFCFAITTGKCQKKKSQQQQAKGGSSGNNNNNKGCDNPLAKITKQHLNLSQLCNSYQVPVPN